MEYAKTRPITAQDVVNQIVLRKDVSALSKAKALSIWRLKAEIEGRKEDAKIYSNAAAGQYIYHYIHTENTGRQLLQKLRPYKPEQIEQVILYDNELKYDDKIRLIRLLAGNFSYFKNRMLADIAFVVVNDKTIRADRKIEILNGWKRKFPNSIELNDAIKSQQEYMQANTGLKNEFYSKPYNLKAVPKLQDDKLKAAEQEFVKEIKIENILNHEFVKGFKEWVKIGDEGVRRILSENWENIKQDVINHWIHKGETFEYKGITMNGPHKDVSMKLLAVEISLNYISTELWLKDKKNNQNKEQMLSCTYFLHAIIGKECNWKNDWRGAIKGLSNGTGPFQLTAIFVYDAIDKINEINEKIQSWGGKPFDSKEFGKIRIGRHKYNLAIKKKNGVYMRNLPYFYKLEGWMAWPIAIAGLINYGASPHMTLEEMKKIARDYNGNPRFKHNYAKEVKARVEMQIDSNKELRSRLIGKNKK
jgi:hypothetical protein